jgi:hypothetical protein
MFKENHRHLIIDALEFRIETLERRLSRRCDKGIRELWTAELAETREAQKAFIALTVPPAIDRPVPSWTELLEPIDDENGQFGVGA